MKVNPFRPVEYNPYKQKVNKVEQKSATGKTDKVEISARAKEMQQIPSIAKEREMRIAELKEQVKNGTYEVNPKEIAESMAKFYRL